MGNSQHAIYKNALDEVGHKCRWAVNLIVDIYGHEKLCVTTIKSVDRAPSNGLILSLDHCLYYYQGNIMGVDPYENNNLHEITLIKYNNVKIGGGCHKQDLIEFDNETIHDGKNIFRSANGKAPDSPKLKYPVNHPDDNLDDIDNID